MDYAKIGLVNIENNVFIGANTTILPNVTIGENSIIGAHSLVNSNIPKNSVAFGCPAKVICSVEEYLNKNRQNIKISPKFDYSYTIPGKITKEKKEEMIKKLKNGMGYVK